MLSSDRRPRGRRKPAEGSPEKIRRESAVARYREGGVTQPQLAAAFEVTDRTFRRWLAERTGAK